MSTQDADRIILPKYTTSDLKFIPRETFPLTLSDLIYPFFVSTTMTF